MNFPTVNEQMDVIRRGTSEIIPEDELVAKIGKSISTGDPLTIKLGCDPSRPDLHLGHSVVLRKMRQFQDLGHNAILIVGDFTGMIGDPSGRSKTRPSLTLKEARDNGQSYFEQASSILDPERIQIQYNSDWLSKMSFEEVIKLSSKYTVARMLERDEFEKRFKNQEPISIHEFLYPLAQAMDSVAVRSDVELGGSDQKFNLLVGRDIQREYGQVPQVILTMPLLEGTDGVEKMSKSLDNYIAFNDSPQDMYGKVLSIPDSLIFSYFNLATDTSGKRLNSIRKSLDDKIENPRDLKRELARTIVEAYYDRGSAISAEEHFDRIFLNKQAPVDMDDYHADPEETILDVMVAANMVASKGEGRRLIQQSAVSLDGIKIQDTNFNFSKSESVLKVGKRRFLKVILQFQT